MPNIVRILPQVQREYLAWVKSLPYRPDDERTKARLAAIHLTAIRSLLAEDDQWKHLAQPASETGLRDVWQIDILQNGRFLFVKRQPRWWQFWARPTVIVFRFAPQPVPTRE